MKRLLYCYLPLVFLILCISVSCKKDEPVENTPHVLKIFENDASLLLTNLAVAKNKSNSLYYCGSTNSMGEPEHVKSMTFKASNDERTYHYILDDMSRVVLVYATINGSHEYEMHKVTYAAWDSIYYSVHYFNWETGENELSKYSGFGNSDGLYEGTLLYEKANLTAFEEAAEGLKLYGQILELFKALPFESSYSSPLTEIGQYVVKTGTWDNLSVSENANKDGLPECVDMDNLPNPTGTPMNPVGQVDECFASTIQLTSEIISTSTMYVVQLNATGGEPPFIFKLDDTEYGAFDGSISIPDVSSGVHFAEVTDSHGCVATTSVFIEDFCTNSDMSIELTSAGGSAMVKIIGGVPPYAINWEWNGFVYQTNEDTITDLMAGTYFCEVFDANLCHVSSSIEVEGKCAGITSIVDVAGNAYVVVQIGTQCWMKENLRTDKYANGADINHEPNGNWDYLSMGAYCIYDNEEDDSEYGKLYNWYTTIDPRKVCPTGWHVPSVEEYHTLSDFLGGEQVAGGKMKTTTLWPPNLETTNSSGFSAKPGGRRAQTYYAGLGEYAYFWTSSFEAGSDYANLITLAYNTEAIDTYYLSNRHDGLSIRCIKD